MMLRAKGSFKPQKIALIPPSKNFSLLPSTKKGQSGYKMPKLKEGEEIIGFRARQNTDIFRPNLNYNFNAD